MDEGAELRTRSGLASLRVLRVGQWVHFAGLPLVSRDLHAWQSIAGVRDVVVSMVATSAALAYAYAVNAVGDRSGDAAGEKNPLAGVDVVPVAARVVTASAAFAAFAAASWLGATAAALVAASLVAGTVYSVGPRGKAVPFVGLVLNTTIFFPLLFVRGDGEALPPQTAMLTSAFVALLVQNQLVHELADAEEDVRSGALTTARFLGERGVRAAVWACGAAGAVACSALASSRVAAGILVFVLAVCGYVATRVRDFARARRVHRDVSLVGGLAAYVAALGA